MGEPGGVACTEQECVRWKLCALCGRRFVTDERDRDCCPSCDPPTPDTWTPFRSK